MKLKKLKPFFEVLTLSLFFYGIHKMLSFLGVIFLESQNFTFSVEYIFWFFTICSLFIIATLLFVKQKSKDNVGNVFMLITCIKVGGSFFLMNQIQNFNGQSIGIEKINFFVIFLVFLGLETLITIRILNNNN